MKNSIYKIFTGEYIDLDKIVSIGEPFITKDTHYISASFNIYFQLMNTPVLYSSYLTPPFHLSIYFPAQIGKEYYKELWNEAIEVLGPELIKYDTTSLQKESLILSEKTSKIEFNEFKKEYNKFIEDFNVYKNLTNPLNKQKNEN